MIFLVSKEIQVQALGLSQKGMEATVRRWSYRVHYLCVCKVVYTNGWGCSGLRGSLHN